jgi:glycosyltransferase 2 family protein
MTSLRKPITAAGGLAVGSICLWLALRDIDWQEAARIVRTAEPSYIALGFALQGTNLLMRSARWRQILLFRSPVRAAVVLQALLVGYAVNGALPAGLGELFRAGYLARRTDFSGSMVLASIVVERLLDLLAALSLLTAGVIAAGGGNAVTRNASMAGAVIAMVAVGILSFMGTRFSPASATATIARVISRLPKGDAVAQKLGRQLGDFARFSRVLRTRRFAAAAAITIPIWLVEMSAVWSICRAVHVDLGLIALLCLMGGASLSTLLPTAPGFIGSYQYAYVLILGQFGVAATRAVIAATTAQLFLIASYIVIGFLVLGLAAVFGTTKARGAPTV